MSNYLTQKEACEFLNISRTTILRWESEGLIQPNRTFGKHRRYLIKDLEKLIGIEEKKEHNQNKKCVIYSRVSTKKQADCGNLERQTKRLIQFANEKGIEIVNTYIEIASGINENRKQLQNLLEKAKDSEIDYLIIEYKDRLARFGYKYLENYFTSHGVQIVLLENQEEKDLNQEMSEDIISIITSFSARLYGRRGAKKVKKTLQEIKNEGEEDENKTREEEILSQ